MGFRKTHRRTKKRGGTRQRGGATQEAVDKAVRDAASITNESEITAIDTAIATLQGVIDVDKPTEGVNVEEAVTRLGELKAMALEVNFNNAKTKYNMMVEAGGENPKTTTEYLTLKSVYDEIIAHNKDLANKDHPVNLDSLMEGLDPEFVKELAAVAPEVKPPVGKGGGKRRKSRRHGKKKAKKTHHKKKRKSRRKKRNTRRKKH